MLFKKISPAFALAASLLLAGCSSASAADDGSAATQNQQVETVTLATYDGEGNAVEVDFPQNPQRLAVMDLAALDILDALEVSDHIVGVSKGSSIDYLQEYVNNDELVNLGTIKEADMEALMESEPDMIIIGGRLARVYDQLAAIAPVYMMKTDTEKGVVESTRDNASKLASLYDAGSQVDDLMSGYTRRIEKIQEQAEGKNAIIGMVNAGGFSLLGNDGRCSLIGRELGFENVGVDAEETTSTHGNDASFEYVVHKNPDYIFALDRDAAIGTEGAKLAEEVLDNELIHKTDAAANNRVIALDHSNIWYTAEGGIQALDLMLADIESALAENQPV